MKMLLNDGWQMEFDGHTYSCDVPCSMYETLIREKAIPDPYQGENEWISTPLSDRDAVFERRVTIPAEILQADRMVLRFAGIDTLADVTWDGQVLGHTDNMHRSWEFALPKETGAGEHLLRVTIHSPSRYVTEMQKQRPLWGVESTMPGYPHLRKAHSSFGWDWGPVLPDLGIWRDVTLEGYTGGRILSVHYTQEHGKDGVKLSCRAEMDLRKEGMTAELSVTAPDGQVFTAPLKAGRAEIQIKTPALWWVRGLGDQPLYRCRVTLNDGGREADAVEKRIGLRTLTVSQQEDQWGREFCFINNGVKFFAMGANYIPEDQLMPGCTPERTTATLRACLEANYNCIRVWGGGYYPGDAFYDFCDEHGIAVWQDFMFACSAYRLTPAFEKTVREEIRDNIIRLRHHPSLALWCGNNEIESAWTYWGLPEDPEAKADYTRLFEEIIPETLKELDPGTFYWPSSPSSGGGFREPDSNLAGDRHYWEVWHSFKPIEAFRQHYYRYCSEYGFESLPDIKTIRYFAEEKDLDLCGPVMEAHQKCVQGTEKLLYYLGQMTNYPYDFERLIYCSQLVQADCIRSNVEHMRRARGRCMGSTYWQVNDSNPVISWSSIDYFGRWKALHYAARKFYAPVLLSCDDTDPLLPVLYVTNDTREPVSGRMICRLRDHRGAVLKTYTAEVSVPALTATACLSVNLGAFLASREEQRTRYLEYTLEKNGEAADGTKTGNGREIISGGTTLFVRPKTFRFLPAEIRRDVTEDENEFRIILQANCFAKSVCLSLTDADCVFSDNWFDLHGDEPVVVTVAKDGLNLTLDDFKAQLRITSY